MKERIRSKYGCARFSLTSTSADYDVNSNHSLFKSANVPSANYSLARGYDDGHRFNIRIECTEPMWVKFNHQDNDMVYITEDVPYEEFNIACRNLYLTSAAETTAQVDRVTTAAESSGNYTGTYFKLYARAALPLNTETVYGIYFTLSSVGTQPTDTEVDTWLAVDLTAAMTATQVADAIEAVIDGVTGVFTSSNAAEVLDITHSVSGARRNAVDVGTPATITTQTEGVGAATTVQILVR